MLGLNEMIDTIVNVLSNLVKLAEVREKNREKYIERYVEPIYKDAEVIFRDYIGLMREVERKLRRARKVGLLLRFLEEKRQENLTVRTKTRAMLKIQMKEGFVTRFERGVWGLMMGSVSSFDKGYSSFGPIEEIRGDHTVLDIADYLANREGKIDIERIDRQFLLNQVQRQISGLEHAWQEVVAGYADLKSEIIPKTGISKKHRHKKGANE